MTFVLNRKSPAIGILDTSIGTENLGDEIIMDACRQVLDSLVPELAQIRLPTHLSPGLFGLQMQRRVGVNIACGTNLLHSHMGLVRQWRIGPWSAFRMRPVVLLGVGWRAQAKRTTDAYTRWLLKRVLSRSQLHSVRDSYSERRLREAGFENIINTGCPTLWSLTPEHCARIRPQKGTDAVVVLTDYSRNPELDLFLLQSVRAAYRDVYFWPQGSGDLDYLADLGQGGWLRILGRNLRSYDQLLADTGLSLDYVGTRLHGGVRALQHGRRSLIVSVDHRAAAMGADFGLPVIDRYSTAESLLARIETPAATVVTLAAEHIVRWQESLRRAMTRESGN